MTLPRLSKSEYQYFYHIIFSKGVFEFATENVDWRLSRILWEKINNVLYATVNLVRAKLSLVQEWKCYLLSRDIWSTIWCMLPQFPQSIPARNATSLCDHTYFSHSLILFTTSSRSPFIVIAWFIILRLHKAYRIVAVVDTKFHQQEFDQYIDYRIKNYEEVSYHISRKPYRFLKPPT